MWPFWGAVMIATARVANDLRIVAFGVFFGAIAVGTWGKLRAGTYKAGRLTAWFGILVCGVGAVALTSLGIFHLLRAG